MGLDMYLHRRRKGAEGLGEEVMYWRKANQVRQYFVDCGYDVNGNCEEFAVTREMLEELVARCIHLYRDFQIVVDEYMENEEYDYEEAQERAAADLAEHAEGVMATSSGFFFGNTSYDMYYFGALLYTAEQVAMVIADTDWENDEVLYYEWW